MIAWEGSSLVITLFRNWETSVRDYFDAYRAMVEHRSLSQWVKIIDFTDYVDPADLVHLLYGEEFLQIRKDIANWSVKRGMVRQVIILHPAISQDLTEQLLIVYDNEGAPAEAVTSRLEAYQRASEILSSRPDF